MHMVHFQLFTKECYRIIVSEAVGTLNAPTVLCKTNVASYSRAYRRRGLRVQLYAFALARVATFPIWFSKHVSQKYTPHGV